MTSAADIRRADWVRRGRGATDAVQTHTGHHAHARTSVALGRYCVRLDPYGRWAAWGASRSHAAGACAACARHPCGYSAAGQANSSIGRSAASRAEISRVALRLHDPPHQCSPWSDTWLRHHYRRTRATERLQQRAVVCRSRDEQAGSVQSAGDRGRLGGRRAGKRCAPRVRLRGGRLDGVRVDFGSLGLLSLRSCPPDHACKFNDGKSVAARIVSAGRVKGREYT